MDPELLLPDDTSLLDDPEESKGGVRAAALLLFASLLLAMSLYGISYNLVLYLTTGLGLSTAAAAVHVSLWTSAHDLSPLIVAAATDAGHISRFRATVALTGVFAVGSALLAASAIAIENQVAGSRIVFFAALYSVAIGKGFVAPVVVFGAEQFDERKESVARSAFFSWYYSSGSAGLLIAVLGIVYVSDRAGFSWALIISAATAILGLAIILGGATAYRNKNPKRVGTSPQLLNSNMSSKLGGRLILVFLIWLGSVSYEAMRSQTMALFVEEADYMDLQAFGKRIPPASLNCFDPISVIVWTVVYDRVIKPYLAKITGNPKGLTLFQRMGTGLLFMTLAMASAAGVEASRLAMVHQEKAAKMSVLWQVPQFAFIGASKVFYYVGLMEFLYEQVPREMKTVGASFAFLSASAGSLFSGLLVTAAEVVKWIPRDLNYGHLDYFFWMLAGLGVVNWACFSLYSFLFKIWRHRFF